MDELITVHHDQGNYVVGMDVDGVAYILFESPYEHEAVGVKTLMAKAVNHLLVFESEKRRKRAEESSATKSQEEIIEIDEDGVVRVANET